MRPNLKRLSAFTGAAAIMILSGANSGQNCNPQPPATCYADDCTRCYCLGPENIIANAPVNPRTCNGDLTITVAGLYWRGEQDGMEYAVDNEIIGTDSVTGNPQLTNLIDAKYKTPSFDWDFGFRVGLSYASPCDGWDIGILWTFFHEGAKSHVEAEFDDNHALLPLWSAYQFPNAGNAPTLFASDIESFWKFDLHLIDIELGRQFWTSRKLSFRPHIGLRLAKLDQTFEIEYKGGSWNDPGLSINVNDLVDLDNDFKGIGIRSGFDTLWNFECGWGVYGRLALSVIYGKFDLDHDERIRDAQAPFTKNKILETKENFRASRASFDLGLGVQWTAMICKCQYGVTAQLGWEQHLFPSKPTLESRAPWRNEWIRHF